MEVKGQVHTPAAFLCKRGIEDGLNRSTVRSKNTAECKRYPGKIYSQQRKAIRQRNINLNAGSDYSTMQDRQCTYKVTLRRVRVT